LLRVDRNDLVSQQWPDPRSSPREPVEWSRPAFQGRNVLYQLTESLVGVGCAEGVVVLDAKTGEEYWRTPGTLDALDEEGVAVSAYFQEGEGSSFTLHDRDGRLVREQDGSFVALTPRAYFVGFEEDDSTVAIYDRANGERIGEITTNGAYGHFVITRELVVHALAPQTLAASTFEGELKWSVDLSGTILGEISLIAPAPRRLFVMTRAGEVVALQSPR
jgi:outer membrane protein assembly factor BamB